MVRFFLYFICSISTAFVEIPDFGSECPVDLELGAGNYTLQCALNVPEFGNTGCHYRIRNFPGYISVNFRKNSVNGYFTVNESVYELYGTIGTVQMRKLDYGKNTFSCAQPSSNLSKPTQRRPKWRSLKTVRYTELIFVVSKRVVEKWENKSAQNLTDRLTPVYEHFSHIFNIMKGHYQKVGIELVLSDIQLWHKHDFINMKVQNATVVLDEFAKWRFDQIRFAKNSTRGIRWSRNDVAQLFIPRDIFLGTTVGWADLNTVCGKGPPKGPLEGSAVRRQPVGVIADAPS
mgnify:CR=1 FL=1